jgi:hypothetical protein
MSILTNLVWCSEQYMINNIFWVSGCLENRISCVFRIAYCGGSTNDLLHNEKIFLDMDANYSHHPIKFRRLLLITWLRWVSASIQFVLVFPANRFRLCTLFMESYDNTFFMGTPFLTSVLIRNILIIIGLAR